MRQTYRESRYLHEDIVEDKQKLLDGNLAVSTCADMRLIWNDIDNELNMDVASFYKLAGLLKTVIEDSYDSSNEHIQGLLRQEFILLSELQKEVKIGRPEWFV